MKIIDKINMDLNGLKQNGPITIVAFGDSVTHGAFANGEIDHDAVYHNLLKKKLNQKRNYIPINMINAGIGGMSAHQSLARLDSHALSHNPDLIIVCFGLNDVNGPLNEYLDALREIFSKSIANGAEVIFMTPNMLNTYVADGTAPEHLNYAHVTAEMQNSGKMDLFMSSAVALAQELGVSVCDCYAEWKKLSKTQDTTMLLANRINHPTREMHDLFASMLMKTIFNEDITFAGTVSTMYQGK